VQIEVVSDIVCPWCYVGKRKLEAALAARPHYGSVITWLPFELNPDMPQAGMPRDQYMRERFGDVNRFAAAQEQLVAIGQSLGIDFRFDGDRHMPNTRRAHMLLRAAGRASTDVQTRLKERLLSAYFTRGENLSDASVLLSAAGDAGLAPDVAAAALDDTELKNEIVATEQELAKLGVSGVPTFIFNRRFAFSGAQDESVFLSALDEAARVAS
jgi:predicted DsbA family dithiol-disulfide isomerase